MPGPGGRAVLSGAGDVVVEIRDAQAVRCAEVGLGLLLLGHRVQHALRAHEEVHGHLVFGPHRSA